MPAARRRPGRRRLRSRSGNPRANTPRTRLDCEAVATLTLRRSKMTLVLWWVTCLIWSSVWLFIKVGLRDLPPVSFAAVRLGVAVVVFIPILLARRVSLPRRRADWQMIAVAGVLLLGVNYALLFWGAQFIPSGLTAVLSAVTPAFALVF